MVRPTLIDLNPVELKYYPFMISLDNHKCKKDYSWNLSTCICENSKYLQSVIDTSVNECAEIITVMDIVSVKMTNTIAINVTSTASINRHSKKVRDSYILHTVLLVIILILIIIIICYYFVKQKWY